MKNLRYIIRLTNILLLIVPTLSLAWQKESYIDVSATIIPFCTIYSDNINFGAYNIAKSDETTVISVLCTKGTEFIIGLDNGSYKNSDFNIRTMKYKSSYLNYGLYQDKSRTINWGDGTSNSLFAVGTGTKQMFTIYGQILDNQIVPPGNYLDTVNISLTFKGVSAFFYKLSLRIKVAANVL